MNARVAPLHRNDITDDVATQLRTAYPRVGKFFAASDAPPMPAVLGLLARHPAIAGPWLGYSGSLLDGGVLDARTRELLILATAARTGAEYLWNEHETLSSAWITPAEREALRTGVDHSWTPSEAALLSAVDELIEVHRVSDTTWGVLAEHLDTEALLEVLFIVGTYTCLAMVFNSTDLADREEVR